MQKYIFFPLVIRLPRVRFVINPCDPTPDEIQRWAAGPDSLAPLQDWDLMITGVGNEELFLELVEDEQCPKADFMLHCLYLWVYQTVHTTGWTEDVERLIQRGEASSEPALKLWARRSRNLVANPKRAEQQIWWQFGQRRTDSGAK